MNTFGTFLSDEFKCGRRLARLSAWMLLAACGALFPLHHARSAELVAEQSTDGHVALILPLNSPAYGKTAEAVKKGFLAARVRSASVGAFPIRIYPTDGSVPEILEAYQLASHNGAVLVVGPLTHNGVTGLVRSNLPGLPTLALNKPEPDSALPSNFHFFGLGLEEEARQTAQLMWQKAGPTVFVVASSSPLFNRAANAFAEEWTRLGGGVIGPHQFSANPDELMQLRRILASNGADALFLAADDQDACKSRPFLERHYPIYGLSLANAGFQGKHCLDLRGIYFLDMPWMVAPPEGTMATYPGLDDSDPVAQRFFALGADTYQLATALMQGAEQEIQGLPGLSGQISYADNVFSRVLTSAVFDRDGIPKVQADTANRPSPAQESSANRDTDGN